MSATFGTPDGDTLDLDVADVTEGAQGANISKLLAKHGHGHLRPGLRQHRVVHV